MLKRLLCFAYGTIAYVLFLGTFSYAIGFVGNIVVPTRLDGPATEPWTTAIVMDLLLLSLFAVQHSVMARKWFKDRWTRIVPRPIERSTYVVCASLALATLVLNWKPLGGTVWSVESSAGQATLYALFACGWGLVLVVTFVIDHFDLFGLRQVWLYLRNKPYVPHRFVTPGPYRMVRHPLYAGFVLAFWATPTMTVSHLMFAIATSLYILVAIQFEERDLVREHGRAYESYRRRVPMLVPMIVPSPASSREGAPSVSGNAPASRSEV